MNLIFEPPLENLLELVFSREGIIQQHEWELRTLLRMVKDDLKPKRTVELGSWKGFTGAILSRVTSVKTVSIDNAEYGRYEEEAEKLGKDLAFIIDDCCSDKAIQRSMDLLRDEIDLLFIDDGHSYEDVTKEVAMWKPFVRYGGWIVFHDINPLANRNADGQHPANCQVHRFWPELQGNKVEIIATSEHKDWRGVIPHGGIGIWKV